MVIPLKRQATMQRARKGASRMGLIRASCPQPCGPTPAASSKIAPGDFVDLLARTTLLRALRMRYGHSTRRNNKKGVRALFHFEKRALTPFLFRNAAHENC